MTESGSGQRVAPRRRALMVGAGALVAAISILLLLPLESFGLRRPGVSLGGNAVSQVVRAVPQVTGAVNNTVSAVASTVHSVVTPSSASSASASGTAPASAVAAPARSGSAVPAITGTPSTPAAYGTNPAGQGTVAAGYLPVNTTLPYPYSAKSGGPGEILTIGRGRSEQAANGTYDAHTTILMLAGLALTVDAAQGETKTGPLDAVQTGLLDKLCTATGQAACLTLLAANTAATTTGASTHFAIAQANLLGAASPIKVGVAQSDSMIQTSGSCQTASGSSSVADIAITGVPFVGAGKSSESSQACAGQTPTQTASSSFVTVGGQGLSLPAAGCANGTPNTDALPILDPIVKIICNADSTVQLATPDGVREALSVVALQAASTALLKVSAAASQSHAVAPAAPPKPPVHHHHHHHHGNGGQTNKCKDKDHDCGKGPAGTGKCANDPYDHDGDCVLPGGGTECTADSDHDCGKGPGAGTAACANDPVDHDGDCDNGLGGANNGNGSTGHLAAGNLPFTGQNVLDVVFTGLILLAVGLVLMARTRRRKLDRP